MILRKSKDKEYYYCSSFVRNYSCTNHSIRKDKLILRRYKESDIDVI